MKVALFGSKGFVGSAVLRALKQRKHSCLQYAHQSLADPERCICLSNKDLLTRKLLDEWPDAVINCAAISSPDSVNQDPLFARKVNVEGAISLAEISAHLGCRYIHLSSDMIFDGTSSPYRSTDIPNPLSEYGRQKLEAEKGVLAVTDENLLVLRLTLVNGNSPSGRRSPHERILNSLFEGKPITLFDDEIRQPCSAENIASVVVELLERPNLNGLFHWSGANEISRYELGIRILDYFGFRHDRVKRGMVKDYPCSEERPRCLSFELAPLVGKLKTKPATIDEQIQELKLPVELFQWFRQNVDYPERYVHKF